MRSRRRITASTNMQNIKDDVAITLESIFRDAIESACDNLAATIGYQVKSYNADWCSEEAYDDVAERFDQAIENAVYSLIDPALELLFKYAPRA